MRALFVLLTILISCPLWGATVWVNPAGSATSPYDTKAKGLTTIQAGVGALSSGDTLMIANGTYTGASNAITDSGNQIPSGPGTGTGDSRFTILKAETDGSVVIDGEYTRAMLCLQAGSSGTKSWIKFEGIIWCKTASSGVVGDCFFMQGINGGTYNHHIYLSKCGFYDPLYGTGDAEHSGYGMRIRYTDYVLVENCYVWGDLYYGIMIEQCNYAIFRQCVGRYDQHRGALGGVFGIYSSDHVEVQNCIVLDCDQSTFYTYSTFFHAFAYPTTDGDSTYVHTVGCIALNLQGSEISYGLFSQNGGGTNNSFEDCVFWDSDGGFYDRVTSTTYNHCVFGKVSGDSNVDYGLRCDAAGGTAGVISNSILMDNSVPGFRGDTTDYNAYYNNSNDVYNTQGTHDYCTENSNSIDPDSSWKYIPRIETSSTLSDKGSDAGRIGPSIMYKVGTIGTFYSDDGYATVTSDDLWPFPNEDLIKTKMAAYTGNTYGTVSGARGFCTGKQLDGVTDQTLTAYIWEYLGNQMPSDIYGEGDTTPPTITGGFGGSLQ